MAELVNKNIRRNLGTFAVPQFNSVGDPSDKFGKNAFVNRPNLCHRDGLQPSQPMAWWREAVHRERRYMPSPPAPYRTAADATPVPPPPLPNASGSPPPWSSPPGVGWPAPPPGCVYVPCYLLVPAAPPPQ